MATHLGHEISHTKRFFFFNLDLCLFYLYFQRALCLLSLSSDLLTNNKTCLLRVQLDPAKEIPFKVF